MESLKGYSTVFGKFSYVFILQTKKELSLLKFKGLIYGRWQNN